MYLFRLNTNKSKSKQNKEQQQTKIQKTEIQPLILNNNNSDSKMEEQPIVAARASVMIYDDDNKKWIHSGTSTGVSKVHIYQHITQNTFRVVGRKLHDHEVIIVF